MPPEIRPRPAATRNTLILLRVSIPSFMTDLDSHVVADRVDLT